jgi:hypothetical protein
MLDTLPQLKVVILTEYAAEDDCFAALLAGASRCLRKARWSRSDHGGVTRPWDQKRAGRAARFHRVPPGAATMVEFEVQVPGTYLLVEGLDNPDLYRAL